ncbi:FAD-dependent oxidoreductase [Nocardia gamkensis]|uniref:NAD(P)/FAD-dependent oxidoreductase n=1 Tax=Nocardia gamkensis TaxID=352869 RepID=UPI0034103CBE
MTDRLVVVGASLAGLRAVEAARGGGYGGEIALIGAEPHLPYDRPPLSKKTLEPGAPPESTQFRSREMLEDLGVELVLGASATAIDTGNKTITVRDAEIAYSAAVIATGADARRLPGGETPAGVHMLRTHDDALAVRAALDAGARTVVIGAGFIGSEVASAARKRGLPVTIVEALPTPLTRSVGPALGSALTRLHTRNGTEVICGVVVSAIEGEVGEVRRVRLEEGTALDADLVVVGIGTVPATDWLVGSGIMVDNGIVCDEFLATTADGVYAAGDVANWRNPLFGRSMRIEHWTSAAEQGARAALNALNPSVAQTYSTVPYFWSDWYGHRIQFVGVPSGQEHEVVSGSLDSDHFVVLYRDGDLLSAALTLNGQRHIMKYRNLINKRATFDEALAFARARASSSWGTPASPESV